MEASYKDDSESFLIWNYGWRKSDVPHVNLSLLADFQIAPL